MDTTASQSVSSGLGSRCRVDEVTGDVDGRMKSCWRASWIYKPYSCGVLRQAAGRWHSPMADAVNAW